MMPMMIWGYDAAAYGDQLFFKDDLIEINANCHHKQDNVPQEYDWA